MEYSTADYLTGIGQKSFIAELMPRHPVYVNLLPPDARDAIGAVHVDTQPARAMLEQEGFRYEGYVDIFDAGPTLECFRDNIHAARQSRLLPVQLGDEDPLPDRSDRRHPVAGRQSPLRRLASDRRACAARVRIACRCCRYAAQALGVVEGDLVRAVPLSPRDR